MTSPSADPTAPSRPWLALVDARYSCRTYRDEPIAADARRALEEHLAAHSVGPFGSQARFVVAAAEPGDSSALRRLGTYGFIRGATGFLLGAVRPATGPPGDRPARRTDPRVPDSRVLEDYGYVVERAILYATGLGLGTCWLGGTFTRGTFVRRLGRLERDETMPAVVSLGYPGDDGSERIREREAGSRRLPASSLFFDRVFGEPLELEDGDRFATVLEAVRMAPSATNKQPWRIVRRGADWHFILKRNRHYGKGSPLFALLRLADLQRIDLGIAMCHFDLVAGELGLRGKLVDDGAAADLGRHGSGVEYCGTWRGLG